MRTVQVEYRDKSKSIIMVIILQRTGSTELMDNDLLLEDLLSQSAAQKKDEKSKSDPKDNAT